MGVSSSKNMQRDNTNNRGKKEPLKEEYPKSNKNQKLRNYLKKKIQYVK